MLWREGRYLLHSNLIETDPAKVWEFYLELVQVEETFKHLKSDLAIRPIFHQLETRIEAHIFVCFLAHCVQVSLCHQLRARASGLTVRQLLDKFSRMQMMDAHFPTTDGRELVFRRYTQPEPEQQLLIAQMKRELPPPPPPQITARGKPGNGYRPFGYVSWFPRTCGGEHPSVAKVGPRSNSAGTRTESAFRKCV